MPQVGSRAGLRLFEVPFTWREICPSRMSVARLAVRSLLGLIGLRLDLLRGRL
jgi:hypothetical protein